MVATAGSALAGKNDRTVDESAAALESDLGEALETIEGLERRVLESDRTLAEANGHIGALLDHIDTMEGKKVGN